MWGEGGVGVGVAVVTTVTQEGVEGREKCRVMLLRTGQFLYHTLNNKFKLEKEQTHRKLNN